MNYLSSSLYQSLPRLGRGQPLNTIVEDSEGSHCGMKSDGGYSSDERSPSSTSSIMEKLAQLPTKGFAQLQKRPPSVVSSEADDGDPDQCSSRGSDDGGPDQCSSRGSYDGDPDQCSTRGSCNGSDPETIFSSGSCPSLAGSRVSEATSFVTDSSCNSVAGKGGMNRFPALFIPRGSWQGLDKENNMSLGIFTPSTKVILSPEMLARLSIDIPNPDNPPSLGDASSIRSESPRLPHGTTAPPTPDIRNGDTIEGPLWQTLATPLEIAIDDEHSILLSAEEAHNSRAISSNYIDIMHSFPLVPGLTPIDTPLTPSIPRAVALDNLTGESGVQLPAQALAMLNRLDSEQYADILTDTSSSAEEEDEEMQECSVPPSRPHTWSHESPYTEYSVTPLSVPSPSGFFSSLKMGVRSTWCSPTRKSTSPPPPSSTTAENFYKAPWTKPPIIKETVLEYDKDDDTEGPPTVKKSTFGINQDDDGDGDMYDSGQAQVRSHEYEEAYEQGLLQAGEVNLDRTSDWLSAQNTYLSILREAGPASHTSTRVQSLDQARRKAARALQRTKPLSSPKEVTFLQAFEHQRSESQESDVFLHAASRLDSVQSARIATPRRHVSSLLNTHTSKTLEPAHARPKYRGPFSQDPRRTMDVICETGPAEFQTLERQQTALKAIKPNVWSLEAQRTILYNGRLLANRAASERLSQIETEFNENDSTNKDGTRNDGTKKRPPRILDLGGAATASWAWAAATKYPHAKVITVQTDQQAELARSYGSNKDEDCDTPQTPTNHKVMSVPHLWHLPFRDNYFDVISARTLHMFLRAKPVPGVDSIDEWDLTLKECMRVLKPGGILDYFVMDSGISNGDPFNMTDVNLSPTGIKAHDPGDIDIVNEFKSELQKRGYEADGGCGRLMARLKQEGFVGVRRQWIGLPMGQAEAESSAFNRSTFNGHTTFRPAPRPISEVSDIARIVEQYADTEAVQGPVGSTSGVSDMCALLGELLWEEWLVRLRIESGRYTPDTILNGIDEQFAKWRHSGNAAWRGVLGWARKPSRKEVRAIEEALASNHIAPLYAPSPQLKQGLTFKPATQPSVPVSISAPPGIQRSASIRRSGRGPPHSAGGGLTICTNFDELKGRNQCRLSRASRTRSRKVESGEIPMMIVE